MVLAKKRDTGVVYAMKILAKSTVVKRKQVEHTKTERRVLGYTKHPNIVSLHYAFQSRSKLYFVLDYCAGGGGKTLALAARLGGGPVLAHDANPRRMSDLPARAERAGATVEIVSTPSGPHDLVLCDAPCSGSGAWRRSPEGKWRLQPGDLDRLVQTQGEILDTVARLVAPGGVLAYVTCSVLAQENGHVVDAFLVRHPEFETEKVREYRPGPDGDGFFLAVLRQAGQGGRYPSHS